MALNNISHGKGILQTSEGGINNIVRAMQRMRELSIQSANDTLSQSDRLSLQGEFSQLQAEINRISEHTEINGLKVFQGDLLDFTLQSGAVNGDFAKIKLETKPAPPTSSTPNNIINCCTSIISLHC